MHDWSNLTTKETKMSSSSWCHVMPCVMQWMNALWHTCAIIYRCCNISIAVVALEYLSDIIKTLTGRWKVILAYSTRKETIHKWLQWGHWKTLHLLEEFMRLIRYAVNFLELTFFLSSFYSHLIKWSAMATCWWNLFLFYRR